MSARDDGGAAFPVMRQESPNGDAYTYAESGMSLRDYFAAATLQSILRSQGNTFTPEHDAAWCYRVADAMLKERAKS